MLEDGHCLREQALGFCFAAGARKMPIFGPLAWKHYEIWLPQAAGSH